MWPSCIRRMRHRRAPLPSHGSCSTNRSRGFFDQRRAALRPKNVAREYGQLRRDFKTSDTPGSHRWTGFDLYTRVRLAHRPWRDFTRLPIGGGQTRVRRLPGANRRRRERPGSARRTGRVVRLSRPPRRAPWRHPPPRIAPGKRDPRGPQHPRPTAPPRQEARPRPHPDSKRRVARRRVAGRTAGSTGGDGPSRRRSRLDRTSGTGGGGHGGARLPTLVGRFSQSRIMGGRVAYAACRPGNYADRHNVC